MAIATIPTVRGALEARLAAIKAEGGITPWSEAEEKLHELAHELVNMYDLQPFEEMRESEVDWRDRAIFGAVVSAIESAERVLVDRLAKAWSQPPATLLDHPSSLQLRADLGAKP